MKFKTKRYEITKANAEDFNEDGVQYEIILEDGYSFSDGSGYATAADIEELKDLIAEIEKC